MKRLVGLFAVLTLGALVFAGPTGAAQPFMQRFPQGSLTFAAGETCSFAVLVQPTAPDVQNLIFFSDGEVIGPESYVGTATNLDTGKTVEINLSGSFSFVQHSDGSVTVISYGHVLSTMFGTIFFGHTVLEIDANGNVTSRTVNGMARDLCAELAGP